ncbi:dopamine beta-hydroxylase-like isoform X2 [Haliotis rufescens]|uniref:dopamine beta-hydroxylase-like isoform X2 n=1 Tax=Haliotis rufescens TaxID=6454 RepID=UPI00201EDEA3|nr:dopamine beta-hydroxylase-like isoform X2 [Haliotis rufescens]
MTDQEFIICLILCLASDACVTGNTCPDTSNPDVKHFDIRIPETEVPDSETTYVCQQFKVPDEETYHAVAFEPLIDNRDVMHHLLLFGCAEDIGDMNPHQCSGIDQRCQSWLAQWTVGVKGQVCAHPGTGIRFGRGSYSFMSLQIHWNNALKAKNMSDNSGMRVYYTRKLRQYDAGNVQIGQTNLDIPPGATNHPETGGCSGNCTKNLLPHSLFLTRTYIHMHYLGVRGVLEVHRDGKLIQTVAEDPMYQYQLSPIHVHSTPVEIQPGDEMRLTCYFDTKTGDRHRNHHVYNGEGSSSEMCFAFVTYYPRVDDLDQCVQFAEYDVCGQQGERSYGDCTFPQFFGEAREILIPDIIEHCRNETKESECQSECTRSLESLRRHPCMKGRLAVYAKLNMLSKVDGWKWINPLLRRVDC